MSTSHPRHDSYGTPQFDLLITNARIVDGTGGRPRHGAVAVRDGLIVAVDTHPALAEAPAAVRVDAGGDVLAPGFIDLHSHADFSVQGTPAAETQLTQGVTTIVTGNCGVSPFPTRDLDLLRRATSQLGPVFTGEWEDAGGYVLATQSERPGVNIVPQLGHTMLRAHVMGPAKRAASRDEVERMADGIRRAADQGVRGFTTGLLSAPGSYAEPGELTYLAQVAADAGMLYSTQVRSDADHLLVAVDEAIAIAQRSGARLQISQLRAKGPANHGLVPRALERIDDAERRGIDIATDVSPYTAVGTMLLRRLPGLVGEGDADMLAARLRDRDERHRIAAAFAVRFGYDVDPGGVRLADFGQPLGRKDYAWCTGLSLVELGERLHCPPQEAALRVLEAHGGAVAVVNHALAESDVVALLQHPLAAIASDGWVLTTATTGMPHPRSFGTFARVLGRYVRERLISLADAVRKMTSLPASRIGLTDRGTIAPGMVADLVRFDPDRILDYATYLQPWQLAEGVRDVWIAGRRAVSAGALTEDRHGRVLADAWDDGIRLLDETPEKAVAIR